MPNVSDGGAGSVRVATLTLTDAQIKALPTTPVQIIDAPGAGLMVVPVLAVFAANTTAGAYTNFNAFVSTSPAQSSVYLQWDALNNDNNATGPAVFEFFLSVAARRVTLVNPVSAVLVEVGGDLATGSGVDYGAAADVTLGYENAAVSVVGQNNAKGAFTGGNAANRLRVTAFYTVATLP